MKKVLYIVCILLLGGLGYGQISKPKKVKLHYNSIDHKVLEELVLSKVNQLRDSLNIKPLIKDDILRQAALDHSDYQSYFNKLTHIQKRVGKKEPYNRVAYYNGTHSLIGENCAFSYINKNVKLKNGKVESNNTLASLAESLFQSWFHSPGHYANMINEEYVTTGINFSINKKSKKIYATQVFGGKPYELPRGVKVPKDAYGISEGNNKLCDKIKTYKYGSEFFANYLVRDGRDVYIYFHDLNYFKKILSGINDAIAIDIIERNQLPCNKPNVFHGNPVHDGVLKKPVYFYELYKNNQAKKENHLYSYLGTVPESIRGEYQVNTLLIKRNKMCYNSYPVSVPSDEIPLFKFQPLFDTVSVGKVGIDTLNFDMEFYVPFNRGEVDYGSKEFKTLYNRIKGYKKHIKEINVFSYSSVEGSSQQNKFLQEERAKKIIARIKQANLPSSISIQSTSEENWKMFYEQIKQTEYAYLANKTKQEVKVFLTDKNNLNFFEDMLFQERTAKVIVKVNGIIDANSTNDLYDLSLSYRKKVDTKKLKEATIVLGKALKSYSVSNDFPLDVFYNPSIETSNENLVIFNNQLALLTNISWFSLNKQEAKPIVKLIKDNNNYVPLKYNMYCNAIKYMFYEQDTIYSTKELLNGINALKKHKDWSKYETQLGEENFNRLIINYHLGALKFNRRYRKYEEVNESLKVIKNYFSKANMTVQEATKMGLFFNEYYRFDWTIEILKPYLKETKVDEEAIFTFVQTTTLLREEFPDDEYYEYMNKAKNKNSTRFCTWINKDFQVMRYKKVKEVFCNACK